MRPVFHPNAHSPRVGGPLFHPNAHSPRVGGPVLSALLALLLSLTASAQESGTLRISVVLTDANGNATPIPRAQLLISDNPTSQEPRRVRTGADGTVEIRLPPGNYTVESDLPVTLGGRSFVWTEMLDVTAGRDTVLALTDANAEADTGSAGTTGNAGAIPADGAVILNKWRGSIAEIWTPTSHATGFVVDARGLIATNDRTIGEVTDVEVEFDGGAAGATARVKVQGRVIASDRTQGVTIIWINPETIASRQPIAPGCTAASPSVTHGEKVVTLIAPMLEPVNAIPGTASHPDVQSFRVDWRLDPGSAGGPVFTADGSAIGMTVGNDESDRERRRDSYVLPLTNVCPVVAAAQQKMAGAAPPATLLRTEAGLPRTRFATISDPKKPRVQPPVVSASEFDISLLTPAMVGADQGTGSPRSFFGYWMPYVSNAPQVLLVRASPQFEESFWKMLARGAAATQGVVLPPLASFNANFVRMRAFCDGVEIAPIRRFIIEMPIKDRKPIREGLYVFALTDFGPHCQSVRLDLFSEKSPNKPDSRTIDPALFTKIAGTSR